MWSSFTHCLAANYGPLTPRVLYWLAACAAASMLPHIFYPYVGEEGVYAIVAQEMQVSGNYVVPTLYGQSYGRPGLFAWATLPLMRVLGWENVLIATRLVAIAATF